jgi:hypothetical protein
MPVRDEMRDMELSAPVESHEGYAFLHLVAHPVEPDEGLLEKARGDQQSPRFLNHQFSAAASAEVYSIPYSPDLLEAYNFDRRADGWVASQGLEDELWRGAVDPGHVLEFEVGVDGRGHLFCGRAAEEYNGRLLIFENIVAGLTARFLSVLGGLYAAGGYVGLVDVGNDPRGAARKLVMPLVQAITRESYDPFIEVAS